jgi:hypothetical protein
VSGPLERPVVLIAEERSRLPAPVASNDVRVPEFGIGAEEFGGDFLFAVQQVIAAQDLSGSGSDNLSIHGTLLH